MADERFQTTCTQCGATEDHPKVLVNPNRLDEARYHYDCLPFALRVSETADPESDRVYNASVEAAVAGTHGDDLVAHITSLAPTQEG